MCGYPGAGAPSGARRVSTAVFGTRLPTTLADGSALPCCALPAANVFQGTPPVPVAKLRDLLQRNASTTMILMSLRVPAAARRIPTQDQGAPASQSLEVNKQSISEAGTCPGGLPRNQRGKLVPKTCSGRKIEDGAQSIESDREG